MNDIEKRLIGCFQVVFPGIPPGEIPKASEVAVAEWDSIATITMVQVIEDEFRIKVDLARLPHLDSFDRVLEYVKASVS